jgi:hypothetical protein
VLKYRSKTAAAALEEEPGENMPLPKGVNPARAVGKQARQLLGHFYALEARRRWVVRNSCVIFRTICLSLDQEDTIRVVAYGNTHLRASMTCIEVV